jgi:hypothetical protein
MANMPAQWAYLDSVNDGPGGEYVCTVSIPWQSHWWPWWRICLHSEHTLTVSMMALVANMSAQWAYLDSVNDGPGGEYVCTVSIPGQCQWWPWWRICLHSEHTLTVSMMALLMSMSGQWAYLYSVNDGPGGEYVCTVSLPWQCQWWPWWRVCLHSEHTLTVSMMALVANMPAQWAYLDRVTDGPGGEYVCTVSIPWQCQWWPWWRICLFRSWWLPQPCRQTLSHVSAPLCDQSVNMD